MNRRASIAALFTTVVLTAGCSRLDYGTPSPAPLAGVPRQPVAEGGDLQPLVVAPGQDTPGAYGRDGQSIAGGTLGPDGRPIGSDGRAIDRQPGAAAGTAVANVDANSTSGAQAPPRPNAPDIARTELLGGWTISASGQSCKLFMTLTTWTGGYRANTQGCGQTLLSKISAWDLNGKQIQLKDPDGTAIATFYKSASERFDGRTDAGQTVSFFR